MAQVTIKHATSGSTDTWPEMNTEQYQVLWLSGSGWTQATWVTNSAHAAVTTSYMDVYTDWIMINISDPGVQIVIRSSINRGYAFRVAHLQPGRITKTVGSTVSVGELIGRVGGSPNWSCHAHMVVYKDIRLTSPINGLKGVDNLKLGSSPSGAVTSSYASPFPMAFNLNAPGRPMNP